MQLFLGVLGYVFFLAISTFSVIATKKYLGSLLSITSALSLPYILICSFQVFVTVVLGIIDVPCFTYWIILSIFILATCIFEILFHSVFNKRRKTNRASHLDVRRTFIVVALIFLAYVLYDVYTQINSIEINVMLQDDFQDDFEDSAGGGLLTRLFLMICSTYFLGIQRNKLGYMVGVLCLVPNLVVNTKGILLISVLAPIIIRFYLGEVRNVKRVLVVGVLIGVFIFFGSYLYEYAILDDDVLSDSSVYQYIGSKMVAYLIAGVQEFNFNIAEGKEYLFQNIDNVTLAPFSNFFHKFGIGRYLSSVNPITGVFGNLPSYGVLSSNVNTYIGTLYLFSGFFGGLLIHFFWMSITLFFKLISDNTGSSFYIALYSLFMAGFFLGWFEFYFVHTFWSYFIAMTVILDLLFSKRCRTRVSKRKFSVFANRTAEQPSKGQLYRSKTIL